MSRDYRARVDAFDVKKPELRDVKDILKNNADCTEVSHDYLSPEKNYTVWGYGWITLSGGRSPANYFDLVKSDIQFKLGRNVQVRVELNLVQLTSSDVFDTEDPHECSDHRDDCPCSVCRAYRIAVSAQM